ncbi:putative mitogen-activated protein kinase 14C [Drosophila ficusphila]|uniref:putative mitogen-activated protein kinase 14C n=1 Tax=Drosophila ficusphila TaxID=30025 RepID=UPI0007E8861E|nr:putative mitogen-activated protein kinase 14C [Drosophila ficusphila]
MTEYSRVVVKERDWEISNAYEIVTFLGEGSFGQVAKVRVRGTENYVAMKKLLHAFDDEENAKGTYREIRLLKHFVHRNVVGLLNIFYPPLRNPVRSVNDFEEVYLVTQLMDEDLHRFSRSNRISDYHIRYILYQILRGLKYIHSAGVLHRDLKPGNIAVNQNMEVRILDFGLARLCSQKMTRAVGTLRYRAPEVLFCWEDYTKAIDMWSVGCILAELISGYVLFPGGHYFNQLEHLLNIMGNPSERFMRGITNKYSLKYLVEYPFREKRDFHVMFPDANPLAIDLMQKLLEMVPDDRITAEEAMHHPYLRDFIEPHHHDEDIALPYEQNFENMTQSVNCWKELVLHEINDFANRVS